MENTTQDLTTTLEEVVEAIDKGLKSSVVGLQDKGSLEALKLLVMIFAENNHYKLRGVVIDRSNAFDEDDNIVDGSTPHPPCDVQP